MSVCTPRAIGIAPPLTRANSSAERHVVPIVAARPAVLLRVRQSQQSQIAGLLEKLVRGEHLGFFPLVDVGIDFPVDESADRFAKELMGLREARAGNRSLRTGFAQLEWPSPMTPRQDEQLTSPSNDRLYHGPPSRRCH